MNEIFVENAQHYYDLRKKLKLIELMLKQCATELKLSLFLRIGIWEIVPDYIKKGNSFEEFKLKIKL